MTKHTLKALEIAVNDFGVSFSEVKAIMQRCADERGVLRSLVAVAWATQHDPEFRVARRKIAACQDAFHKEQMGL